MITLGSILSDASTGLQTAQTALQVVSNNVSNVNTPGYVQAETQQASLAAGAQGAGVTVADIARITNQYLQAASYQANAGSAAASAVNSTLSQAQSLFGDPTASGSLFSNLDQVFSAFSTYAAAPTSAASSSALASISTFLAQSSSIFSNLSALSSDADGQITADVGTVNGLLTQISQLNTTISTGQVSGADVTGAQNQQGELITQLSSLMNIKVTTNGAGGVAVLAADGTSLVGSAGAATLGYSGAGPTGSFSVTNPGGEPSAFDGVISSGSLGGLAQLRNVDLPALNQQLASLTQGAATAINATSNAYSAVPAPSTLTGQPTGLDMATIAGDFSGATTIAFVSPTTNAVTGSVAIDFSAGTITVNGGAAAAFTPATFLSTLQAAMGGLGGSASYTGGVLSLSSGSSAGLAVADPAGSPSSDGGRSFSSYFGLNNLITSNTVANANTGLQSSDASGFPAGQTLTLQISSAQGAKIQQVAVTTPGGSMANLLGVLNGTSGGIGNYGSFALSATGALVFTPSAPGQTVSVVADQTANSATGTSISQLFGIGASVQASVASNLQLRTALQQNAALLPTATLNLSAAAGTAALEPGDTSGADALSQAGNTLLSFPQTAGIAAQSATLSNYAATVAGAIATGAATAANNQSTTATVATNASTALSTVQGVSIDQQLIDLTTYQQAYNASARMIQAANSLFTTLMNMTQG